MASIKHKFEASTGLDASSQLSASLILGPLIVFIKMLAEITDLESLLASKIMATTTAKSGTIWELAVEVVHRAEFSTPVSCVRV